MKWRDPESDPPNEGDIVELKTHTGKVIEALYKRGRFFIGGQHSTVITCADPRCWREIEAVGI